MNLKFGRSTNKEPLYHPGPNTDDEMDDQVIQTMPPQLPPPRPAAAAPARARDSEINSFLGAGCIYEGKLTFEGRVRIDGKFTGEIFSSETLEIGPDAELEGDIDVGVLVIAGRVSGNITARNRCDLRAPARVMGNITSPAITMEAGVTFDGQVSMTGALDSAVQPRIISKRTASPAETNPTISAQAPQPSNGGVAAPAVRRPVPVARDPSDLLKPVP